MSIVIKGMKIPESCGRCDFNVSSLYCNRTGSEIDRDYEYRERLSDCPISELPEKHGRLIEFVDAGGVIDDDTGTTEIRLGDLLKAYHDMKNAPAILEAEG